jgi:hypothetical protein
MSSRKWSTVPCIDDLAEDIGLEPFLDRALHYEIDFAPEEIFEIELAAHISVERFLPFPERDEHVHVAVRPLLSAYEGAEDADLCNTEPLFISGSCSRSRASASIMLFHYMNGPT